MDASSTSSHADVATSSASGVGSYAGFQRRMSLWKERFVSCPACGDRVSVAAFSDHSWKRHMINSYVSCPYCQGEYWWNYGQKRNLDVCRHRWECLKQLLIRSEKESSRGGDDEEEEDAERLRSVSLRLMDAERRASRLEKDLEFAAKREAELLDRIAEQRAANDMLQDRIAAQQAANDMLQDIVFGGENVGENAGTSLTAISIDDILKDIGVM